MHNPVTLIPAIIVVKPVSTAKADLETMSKQVAQITTTCTRKNIAAVDIILTFKNSKDILKRVKSSLESNEVELLMLYCAKQVAETEKEFNDFISEVKDVFGIKVMCYR